ncbi:hypothetical protein B0H14DRAFT_3128556, partial [Mycena olivaceomarginata]
MDVDTLGFYNPTDVDEPRVYTPMDVDETCGFGVTAWNCSSQDNYERPMDGSIQPVNTSDAHSTNTYPGTSVTFDSVPGLTDSQMKA